MNALCLKRYCAVRCKKTCRCEPVRRSSLLVKLEIASRRLAMTCRQYFERQRMKFLRWLNIVVILTFLSACGSTGIGGSFFPTDTPLPQPRCLERNERRFL